MMDAVKSRASIINDYVASAEEYMMAFALGSEVLDLLIDPENPALLQRGQQYTEDFASIKGIFEELYISTPDTYVLTHTSKEAIGITTRTGESLEEFRNTILTQPELTNLGIMKSPGTGSMILSMYYPLFENQRCIGYVGAGVYLYHQDESLLNTKTADKGYLEILQRIKADGTTQAGIYSYQDEQGIDQLVVYKYLKDQNWVFMLCRGCCYHTCHSADPLSGRQGTDGDGAGHPASWQFRAFCRPFDSGCKNRHRILKPCNFCHAGYQRMYSVHQITNG